MLHAAINGTRTRAEHPAVPITFADQATEARASVAAGAEAIHVHVCDEHGNESLAPGDVAKAIEAIRAECPGIPVGISTGAWIVPDLRRRLAVIRSWRTLPDFASVNLHEAGAAQVMELLLELGIGVEAGIWNAPAAVSLVRSGLADKCVHVLLEPAEASCSARANLLQMEGVLVGVSSGANMVAALNVAKTLKEGVVVTILADSAAKYLSESFWTDTGDAEIWP